MNYEFVAHSMLIFTVTLASGLVKDIEFDETGKGVYGFQTSQKEVAEAIRRHALVRSGRIIDKSKPGVDTRKLKSPQSVKDEASKNGIEIDF